MSSSLEYARPSAPTTNSESAPYQEGVTARSGLEDPSAAPPRVISVASRSPIVHLDGAWGPAAGGLAPIVTKALEHRGGAWVGWDGGAEASPPQRVDGVDFDIYTFSMSSQTEDGFYAGFANRTLWPLLHEGVVPPVFNRAWWDAYLNASKTYTLASIVAADRLGGRPTIWVHDYHLMLVPQMLRAAGIDNPISFFLHTPFPSPAVFARLPQREEILRGLGGADLVGFQTEGDRQRFLAAWSHVAAGPPPHTVAAAASIDVAAYTRDATDPAVVQRAERLRAQLGNRILLFGTERLDYTKGIPERLRALKVLLRRHPSLRKRLVYVQLAHPSRERVPEYQQLRAMVERDIGRLNGEFTLPGSEVPLRYLHRSVSQRELMAYYLAADVAMVTPLRDGMNLVAKEYVVSQSAAKRAGALVLSEFAGAACELTDAFQCNPYDAEGTADAIERALEASDDERRDRLSAMAVHIENNDIETWSDQLLRGAEFARPR